MNGVKTGGLDKSALSWRSRHRDKNGQIGRKHGNTLIRTLRKAYGANFAQGLADNETLSDVLYKLGEPSLIKRRVPTGRQPRSNAAPLIEVRTLLPVWRWS
jgi:hypothetical protein